MQGTVNGQSFNYASALNQAFATANIGSHAGVYDTLVTELGGNAATSFSLALGDTGANVNDAMIAWFYNPNVTLLGGSYAINLDINGRYSSGQGGTEVPEPSTFGLLSAGMIGLMRRRRAQAE